MKSSSLSDALNEALKQYGNDIYRASNIKGLEAGAKVLIDALKRKSPVSSGKFKNGWTQNKKYKGRRYIGNTTLTDEGIPLINIIEYGKHQQPFIKSTFEENKNNIVSAYINAIKSEV
jgi:hypothetical protein